MLVRAGYPGKFPLNIIPETFPEATYTNTSPSRGVESVTGFNADEGVAYIEVDDPNFNIGDNGAILSITNNTTSHRIFLQKRSPNGGRLRLFTNTSGNPSEVWDAFLGSFANGSHKIAIGYSATDLKLFIDGIPICQIEGNFARGSYTQIELGQLLGANAYSETLVEFRYYDTLLTDDQLSALTASPNVLSGISWNGEKKAWAIAGQSNASGFPSGSPTYKNPTKIHLLSNAMTLAQYSDPLDDATNSVINGLDTDAVNANISCGGFFADRLHELTGEEIAVFPTALPATSFRSTAGGSSPNWNPKGTDYITAGTKFTGILATAMSAILQNVLASQFFSPMGTLWLFGESDIAGATSKADFKADMKLLIEYYRMALRNPNYVFILSGVPKYNIDITDVEADYNAIIDAYREIADEVDNVFFVDGNQLPGISGNERNYNLNSMEAVGVNNAEKVYQEVFRGSEKFANALPAQAKVVQIGTSLTDQGFQEASESASTVGNTARGSDSWARFLSEQKFDWVNRGVAGNQISNMVSRFASDVVSEDPDIVIFEAGTNDASRSFEDITTDLANLYALAEAEDYIVIPMTIAMRESSVWSDEIRDKILLVNDWIMDNYRNAIDSNKYFSDPTTNRPREGTTDDGTHWSNRGAFLIGKSVNESLRIFGSRDLYGTALSPNPDMTGTGGTFATGASGVLPDDFRLARTTGTTTGTAVASVDSGVVTLKFSPGGGDGTETWDFRMHTLNTPVTAGDVLELLAKINVSAWSGWRKIQARLFEPGNSSSYDLINLMDETQFPMPDEDFEGLLRTAPLTANGTFVRLYLNVSVDPNAEGVGTLTVEGFQLQEV